MENVEGKILILTLDKKNKLKNGSYVPSKIITSADGFVTLSLEKKDGTKELIRLGEVIKLAQRAGVVC